MSELIDDQEGQTYEVGRRVGDSTTHTDEEDCLECQLSCEDLWSQAQSEALQAMSEGNRFMSQAIRRAKRAAGQYAALFLSDENTSQAGRFYWPGLAAFAAKQVVDGIEYADESMDSWIGQVRAMAAVSFYYLLKGNLWVFLEVAPWMLFYRRNGKELFNHCVDRRDVNAYDAPVKNQMQQLPWALGKNVGLEAALRERINVTMLSTKDWGFGEIDLEDNIGVLAEVNQCRATAPLKEGFNALQRSETESAPEVRAELAKEGAARFLDHEQRLHLQAMIYDHADFQFAMQNNDLGRAVNDWVWDMNVTGAQEPELVFNSEAKLTPGTVERELMPHGLAGQDVSVSMGRQDGKLYNVNDRMAYVARILDQYHWLMNEAREYMVGQLRQIEGWKDA